MTALSNNFEPDVRALCAAGDSGAMETLLAALDDGRRRVARAARFALAERFVVPRARLLHLFAATAHAHTRTQVLALLARGGRVDSMVSLLQAVVLCQRTTPAGRRERADWPSTWAPLNAAAEVRLDALAQACRHLDDWLATWAPLARDEACRLAAAVLDAEDALPPAVAERLWAYVREQRRMARPARKHAPARRKPRVELRYLGGRVRRRSYELAPGWVARVRGFLRV